MRRRLLGLPLAVVFALGLALPVAARPAEFGPPCADITNVSAEIGDTDPDPTVTGNLIVEAGVLFLGAASCARYTYTIYVYDDYTVDPVTGIAYPVGDPIAVVSGSPSGQNPLVLDLDPDLVLEDQDACIVGTVTTVRGGDVVTLDRAPDEGCRPLIAGQSPGGGRTWG